MQTLVINGVRVWRSGLQTPTRPQFLGVSPGGMGIKCHTVIVNFCSMRFYQPLHMQKLKDDMIVDDKNDG